ncbi:MAG: hypothetical protein OXH76_05590 [Boseongicola sp.]|nr:hypothetical protein [Boseongicola sp.]
MRVFWLNGGLVFRPTTSAENQALSVLHDSLKPDFLLVGQEAWDAEDADMDEFNKKECRLNKGNYIEK